MHRAWVYFYPFLQGVFREAHLLRVEVIVSAHTALYVYIMPFNNAVTNLSPTTTSFRANFMLCILSSSVTLLIETSVRVEALCSFAGIYVTSYCFPLAK